MPRDAAPLQVAVPDGGSSSRSREKVGKSAEENAKRDKKAKREKKAKRDGTGDTASAAAGRSRDTPVKWEEDWEANRKRIEELCNTAPNNVCNDCNQNGTRWASVNHGIFVCIRCSGIHRSLGTHISKVKSTNMDKWTAAEVSLAAAIGNHRGKELYECNKPRGMRLLMGSSSSDAEARIFIEKKYSERAYAAEDLAKTLKRLYKQTGYGRKPDKMAREEGKTRKDNEGAGDPTVDVAKKTHENPMKALYGVNAAIMEKKKKKMKAIEGIFGTVNVLLEEYDFCRTMVNSFFGMEGPQSAQKCAAVSAAETDVAAAPSDTVNEAQSESIHANTASAVAPVVSTVTLLEGIAAAHVDPIVGNNNTTDSTCPAVGDPPERIDSGEACTTTVSDD